jgi:class 3 adenylate cyclase
MAQSRDRLFIARERIRDQIHRSYRTALQGVYSQTQGITKLSEVRVRKAAGLDHPEVDAGIVSDLRSRSPFGVNHKEEVAVLAVDMRGSTRLAEQNTADGMFVLVQCFIPLLAFAVHQLRGEVIGLRGDGLIAAFGFGDQHWRPGTNRAYESGMIMIEAVRDELRPFLLKQSIPVPLGIGVGIDCGEVTFTKIGLGDALEVTAYGSAVNTAAKNSKLVNKVWLSKSANHYLHGVADARVFTHGYPRLQSSLLLGPSLP